MKHIYLIRHGLPDFPGGERMCLGTTDIPLGPEGLRQAEQMAKRLPPVSAVYASPLRRAIQTAGAIGQPITIVQDLRELGAGVWEGLTFTQIREKFPALYAARGRDKSIPLPGGEDHDAGLARFRRAMEHIARSAPGDAAVVAHGGITAQFLRSVSGTFYKPDYCEILHLTWENDIFTLQEESL